jgi:hypothetical protein
MLLSQNRQNNKRPKSTTNKCQLDYIYIYKYIFTYIYIVDYIFACAKEVKWLVSFAVLTFARGNFAWQVLEITGNAGHAGFDLGLAFCYGYVIG